MQDMGYSLLSPRPSFTGSTSGGGVAIPAIVDLEVLRDVSFYPKQKLCTCT